MARDILSEFGPDHNSSKGSTGSSGLSSGGGKPERKDVHAYKPPRGPSSINNPKAPGLHGDVHGCGTQGKH